MADQAVQELLDGRAELGGFGCKLLQRLGQAVCHLHVAAAQRAQQLVLVVTGDAEGVTGADHPHDEPQHTGCVGAAVDEVPDEHRPPLGMPRADRSAVLVAGDRVAEFGEQRLQLRAAAVDVADDVERPGLVPQVVVQRPAHD